MRGPVMGAVRGATKAARSAYFDARSAGLTRAQSERYARRSIEALGVPERDARVISERVQAEAEESLYV